MPLFGGSLFRDINRILLWQLGKNMQVLMPEFCCLSLAVALLSLTGHLAVTFIWTYISSTCLTKADSHFWWWIWEALTAQAMRWHLKWQIQCVIYYFHFEAISWSKSRSDPRISGVVKDMLHADWHGSNEKGTNSNKLYKNTNQNFIIKSDKSCLYLIMFKICFSHVIMFYVKKDVSSTSIVCCFCL